MPKKECDEKCQIDVKYPFRFFTFSVTIVVISILATVFGQLYDSSNETVFLQVTGVTLVSVCILMKFQLRSEHILVIPQIGINITSVNRLGQTSSQFYEECKIKDVVIIEAITMQKVKCYLAIIHRQQKSEKDIISPLFLRANLPLSKLRDIYQQIQKNLFCNRGTAYS